MFYNLCFDSESTSVESRRVCKPFRTFHLVLGNDV